MYNRKLWVFLILAISSFLLLSLSSCSEDMSQDPLQEDETQQSGDDLAVSDEELPADTSFTLYFDADESVNPYYGTNSYNEELFGLIYESLFIVDDSFEAVPILCESYETVNGISWNFTIRRDVTFHNGDKLTADDVVYSLQKAAESDKYSSRLSQISSVTKKDEYSLNIMLSTANYSFIKRLDVPIVQYDTAWKNEPEGTGPYKLVIGTGRSCLTAYTKYRNIVGIPIDRIELTAPGESPADDFSRGTVDIINCGEDELGGLNIHKDCEIRSYNTSVLLYAAFNTEDGILGEMDIRTALGDLIDRENICANIYDNTVRSAPYILNSALASRYDTEWEENAAMSPYELTEALSVCGFSDTDGDGFLESRSGEFVFTILVNSENEKRVETAQRIMLDMQSYGIDARLSSLPWEEYLDALKNGEFSLYLGEMRLTSDFDVSELFLEGGEVNYGGISGGQYEALISAFLGAVDDETGKTAAKNLCDYVKLQADVIPIAYKKGVVLSNIGVVSGLEPSQSTIFGKIGDWTCSLKSK